jgi:predicted nucleic acid-binding protein
VSALLIDAGALRAVEQGNRAVIARLRAAQMNGLELRTTGVVLAEIWRGERPQSLIRELFRGIDVMPLDQALARKAGELQGKTGTYDVAAAALVALARPGDRIVTDDERRYTALVAASGVNSADLLDAVNDEFGRRMSASPDHHGANAATGT